MVQGYRRWEWLAGILFLAGIVFIYSCSDNSSGPVIPEISSISPTSGPPGSTVTISGSGFSATASDNRVTFNGVLANVSASTGSSIQAAVPDGAKSGAVTVVVNGQTAVGPNFTVEEAMPGITSVDPDSGTVGTAVTINGMNFSPTASENIVTFNGGVISAVDQASDTTLATTVPEGAVSGPIQVEVDRQKTLSPSFEVIGKGALQMVTQTTGDDLDPDGYKLTLDNGQILSLSANATVTLEDLTAGSYRLELSEVDLNCKMDGAAVRSVTVSDGATTTVTYSTTCYRIAKIAFVRNGDMWVMNGDGSRQIELDTDPDMLTEPVWAPDGTKFAYWNSSGNQEIYVVDMGNLTVSNITNDAANDFQPRWSPDGNLIAYVSDRSGDDEIWVADDQGLGPVNRTNDPGSDADPQWSPDGSKFAFVSDRSGTDEIWVMDADGSNPTQLTSAGAIDPRWSPDGTEISFLTGIGGDVWKMNADGTNQVNVTNSTDVWSYAWSPDGSQFVYRGGPVGNRDVFVIDVDGSNRTNLTNDSSFDENPGWSPDGSRIVYDGGADIWFIWSDGSGRVNLTDTPNVSESIPAWQAF